ncbi:MAG: hypothetical protein L3J63_07135, partial [Geopsychrobacter sp.]|nr:hypothetical protein [Geopsychrobacter sp.]
MSGKYSGLVLVTLLGSLFLSACSAGVQSEQKKAFVPRTQSQTVFVVPFTTIMVPPGVAEGLFDRFVDTLNADQPQGGLEYVILKQGLEKIDKSWLAKRDYVTGEIFAYV